MTVTIAAAAVSAATLVHLGATTAVPARGLAVAALSTWIVDAVSGGYMLATWISRGGLRRQRISDRLAPRVVFSHFALASTGLLVWISYLATSWIVLAWLAVGALMLAIGLGISTVTLWTPFPAHSDAEVAAAAEADAAALGTQADGGLPGRLTDEMLARALTDEALLARLVDNVVASVPANPSRAERAPRPHLATIVPAGHGLAAIATFLLALLTAASAR
jgi:hypothetical protein